MTEGCAFEGATVAAGGTGTAGGAGTARTADTAVGLRAGTECVRVGEDGVYLPPFPCGPHVGTARCRQRQRYRGQFGSVSECSATEKVEFQ
jgi:hypothetical protein